MSATKAALLAATEPDRDSFTGEFIRCVVCSMSPQYGGTGLCSIECAEAFDEAYPMEPPC